MAEDQKDQAQGTEPAEGQQSSPSYVTAEDLQAFRNGMFADIRKMVDGVVSKARPEAKGAKARTEETQQQDPRLDELVAQRDFSKAIRKHSGLSGAQVEMLEEAYLAVRPENADQWLSDRVQAFAAAGNNHPATNPKDQQVVKPENLDRGAPGAPPKWEQKSNPLEWTAEEVDRFISERKTRAEGRRELRQKVEDHMRTVHVVGLRGRPG